jgi:hypothetical protein
MGWTFEEFSSQPTWFIDQIMAYMEAENLAYSERRGNN